MQIKTKIVSTHTADSKPVKQEVNGTVTLPPLVFLGIDHKYMFGKIGVLGSNSFAINNGNIDIILAQILRIDAEKGLY